jgi:hypothetical protein
VAKEVLNWCGGKEKDEREERQVDKTGEIVELVLPEGILEYFEYSESEKKNDEIKIVLVEKSVMPKVPEEYRDRKIRQKGFKEITIDDFPIRGRKVKLILQRRVWQVEGESKLYKRDIPIAFPGTRLEKEFADFLKEGD